jgi:hypothetical protein
MVAIDITDEQYRTLDQMRKKVRTGRRTQMEPFRVPLQKIMDAYISPGKD